MVGIPKMRFKGPAVPKGNPPQAPRPSVTGPKEPKELPAGQESQAHYMADLGEMVRDAFSEIKHNGHHREDEMV
jgi:hypothetical protein